MAVLTHSSTTLCWAPAVCYVLYIKLPPLTLLLKWARRSTPFNIIQFFSIYLSNLCYYHRFGFFLLGLTRISRHDLTHTHSIHEENDAGLSKRWLKFIGERRKNRFHMILSLLFYQFLLCEAAWEHEGGLCPSELEIMSCSPGFGFLISHAILITPCWIFFHGTEITRAVSISYTCLYALLFCYRRMHKRKVFNFIVIIIILVSVHFISF